MTSEVQIFNYEAMPVRTIDKDGEIWFVAKDVCDILEIADYHQAVERLDDDERNTLRISEGIQGRGNPNMNVINESGLYRLTFRSNKPEAKKFTKWVTSKVLPALRKTETQKDKNAQMTSEIQVFSYETMPVRAIEIDGEAWFVGKDVAEILGYADTDQAIRMHVEDEDKLTRQFNGSGQNRAMTIINESGLYSLILSSKLPGAKKFKHWVTSKVLPSIRKTGSYGTRTKTHSQHLADFDRAMENGKAVYTSMGYKGKKLGVALDRIFQDYMGYSALRLAGVDPDEVLHEYEPPLSTWKRQILDYLKEHDAITPKDLTRAYGLNYNTAQQNLSRMEHQGYLRKVKYGVYVLND